MARRPAGSAHPFVGRSIRRDQQVGSVGIAGRRDPHQIEGEAQILAR
jgi:hypothetical protein